MHPLYLPVLQIIERAANEIILPHFRNLRSDQVVEKSPGDLVTVADSLSETMLSDALTKLSPGSKIVGEEAVAADASLLRHLADDMVWVIDPIDGTGNFAAGRPSFGIIIALVQRNETIAAWLFDPLNQRICHAVKGGGAYINGAPISTPPVQPLRPVAALATEFMADAIRELLFATIAGQYDIAAIPFCAAEQYPRLALGVNDITVFERALPWDHAAGVLFLNEAGGKCAHWDGTAYRPADQGKKLLGASSPAIWDEAAERLSIIFDI